MSKLISNVSCYSCEAALLKAIYNLVLTVNKNPYRGLKTSKIAYIYHNEKQIVYLNLKVYFEKPVLQIRKIFSDNQRLKD